jgi:hypothetical protein
VIVRILTEGQYKLDDDVLTRVNELDNACVSAVESGDEETFRSTFAQLLELVRSGGKPLPEDDLSESDVMLPPPDLTMEEAGQEFTGDGLIPD